MGFVRFVRGVTSASVRVSDRTENNYMYVCIRHESGQKIARGCVREGADKTDKTPQVPCAKGF